MAGGIPGLGYRHRMCLWLSTRSTRSLPRSAIIRYPGIGDGVRRFGSGVGAAPGEGAEGFVAGEVGRETVFFLPGWCAFRVSPANRTPTASAIITAAKMVRRLLASMRARLRLASTVRQA